MHDLQRRTFLKFAGLGLSLPLASQFARMAGAQPLRASPKLAVFFTPHGNPVEHLATPPAGPLSLAGGPGEDILAPLLPYEAQTNLLRGIAYKGYDNHPAIAGVLTNGSGASLEQRVASHLGTRPLMLGAIPWRPNDFGPDSQLFHDGGDWVKPELNPVKAADRLFTGNNDAGDDDTADFRKAALSLTRSEVDALRKETRNLTRTRDKLGVHLEALDALMQADDDTGGSCEGKPDMPAVEAVRAASQGGSDAAYFLDHANFEAIYEAQLELAGHALACGATDVLGFQTMFVNATINFGFMGVAQDHHDPLSHSADLAGRGEFAKAQRWLLERFEAHVLQRLAQTPSMEQAGTSMLDDTLVYWCTEIADGNEHNCDSRSIWPGGKEHRTHINLVTIGSAGGRVRTGQVFEFDNRPHPDLLATIADALGASGENFGMNSTGLISEMRV